MLMRDCHHFNGRFYFNMRPETLTRSSTVGFIPLYHQSLTFIFQSFNKSAMILVGMHLMKGTPGGNLVRLSLQ